MAVRVKTVHDVNGSQGMLYADPREDEARAKEASARADKQLRASMAAQMAALLSPRVSVSGSPNGPPSQAAELGHQIANPWLREEREKAQQQESLRYQQNRADEQGRFNSQQDLQRTALEQQFVNAARDAMLKQFGMQQQGQLAREGMQAEQGRFDRQFAQQGEQFDKTQSLQREGMAADQSRFQMGMQADLGKFMAGLQESRRGQDQARQMEARRAAGAMLEPLLEALSRGDALGDDAVTKLQFGAIMNPEVAPELQRIFSNPAMKDLYDRRFADETSFWGGMTDPSNSKILTGLGVVDTPYENKRKADEMFKRLQALGGPGQSQDHVADYFRNLLLQLMSR
jgi:hypothetical protein